MSFVLVQFWGQLPTVVVVNMGDKPLGEQPSGNFANQPLDTRGSASRIQPLSSYDDKSESRVGGYGQQILNVAPSSYAMQPTSSQQQAQQGRPDSFNMGSLGGVLPDISYHNYTSMPPQRYQSSPASSQPIYQAQNVPQYSNTQTMPQNIPYNTQYPPQYTGIYAPGQTPSP